MNDETKPSREEVAVGSDSNEGLGVELTAAYFAGFHKRDDYVAWLRDCLNRVTSALEETLPILREGAASGMVPLADTQKVFRMVEAMLKITA